MENKDVIKNLRKVLKASDQLKDEQIDKILGVASDAPLSDEALSKILNDLIVYKRGESTSGSPQPLELPLTNNIVLKKLRVAFEIKEENLVSFVKELKDKTQAREWSAYFRKATHKHYRNCPDEFLTTVFRALQKYKG